jgi:hypothetical protein
MKTLLTGTRNTVDTLPGLSDPSISLEADEKLARVVAAIRTTETDQHELRAQRDALVAPRPIVSQDPTAAGLARAEALVAGATPPSFDRVDDTLQKLTSKIAAKEADLADLRQLEARERARVSAAICAEAAPAQRASMDQLVRGLLDYNAGAEAERALREGLIDAGVQYTLRPIVVHALGVLRDEWSGISLQFRELLEYGLLKAEYEQRAIAAGWRP